MGAKKSSAVDEVAGDPAVVDAPAQPPTSEPEAPPPTAAQIAHDEARAAGKRPIEEWAEVKGVAPGTAGYWKYASTVRLMGWNERDLVTEEEFDQAMTNNLSAVIR